MSRDTEELLTESLLEQAQHLSLTVRAKTPLLLNGMHASSRRGGSTSFQEHTLYVPGDDLKHLDWRVFAKSERFHVKQYEDETYARMLFVIDRSGSMGYQGKGLCTKKRLSDQITALLSYVSLHQGDAVGVVTHQQNDIVSLPVRQGAAYLFDIAPWLQEQQVQGPGLLSTLLHHVALLNMPKTCVMILSDLFEPDLTWVNSAQLLKARGHSLWFWHLLNQQEINFEFDTQAVFQCMESERKMVLQPRLIQKRMQQRMQQFLKETEDTLQQMQARYTRVMNDAAWYTYVQKAIVLGRML